MGSKGSQNVDIGEATKRNLVWVLSAGSAGILIYALQFGDSAKFASVVSVGVLAAGASLLAGTLLGFLFGIPRTLQGENPPPPTPGSPPAATTAEATLPRSTDSTTSPRNETTANQLAYRVNTNLEQISDWLTKILVGVGLTQLTSIPGKLHQVATFFAKGMGDANSSEAAVVAILLYFAICGFLAGYLWTRLFLAGAFRQADLSALGIALAQAREANKQVEKLQEQQLTDATALTLAERQLNPRPGVAEVPEEELKAAIRDSSPPVKVQIFSRAEVVRRTHWKSPADKPTMERTIPIFRSLAECDAERRFHQNHGQLGFALKDKTVPDWKGAEDELTQAIEIRDRVQDEGWLFYEFNRAICQIMLDTNFQQDRPSASDNRDRIVADLKAAWQSDLKAIIDDEAIIQKWTSLNGVSLDQ
jgi:hypothetical protein